jgi:hypothetical protein
MSDLKECSNNDKHDTDCQDQIVKAALRIPFEKRTNDQQALIYATQQIAELQEKIRWIDYDPTNKETWPKAKGEYVVKLFAVFNKSLVLWSPDQPWQNSVVSYFIVPDYLPQKEK